MACLAAFGSPKHLATCSGHGLSSVLACCPYCNVMTKQLRNLLFASLAVVLAVACSKPSTSIGGEPIVLGYSNWAGWWPWAIAVEEKLFEKNGVNVEM